MSLPPTFSFDKPEAQFSRGLFSRALPLAPSATGCNR
jgi:hypothetical protein